jgi:hypothetical protein
MLDIVNVKNAKIYFKNKINAILPRSKNDFEMAFRIRDFAEHMFISVSLDQFQYLFCNQRLNTPKKAYKILIDIANGNMIKLFDAVKTAKDSNPNLIIMIGNISNPETLEYLYNNKIYADYIRLGVGNGQACQTSTFSGIGYPQASLIQDCYHKLNELNWIDKRPKLISDGGHKDYSDIIKALNLGADYVMIGSIFSHSIESCGKNFLFKKILFPNILSKKLYKILPIYKQLRGMSTKNVQKIIGKNLKLKSEEGIIKYNKINFSLNEWIKDFESYLRSAMSYSNCQDLKSFIGKNNYIKITYNSFKRFKK